MLILDMLAIFDVEHGALGSGTAELNLKRRKATLLNCLIYNSMLKIVRVYQ